MEWVAWWVTERTAGRTTTYVLFVQIERIVLNLILTISPGLVPCPLFCDAPLGNVGMIPPSLMLPPRRLEGLFKQAQDSQRNACLYHNSRAPFSLYTDHSCARVLFPGVTTNVLAEHDDEVWNVEWSPDGKYLASGGLDRTVMIWHIGARMILSFLVVFFLAADLGLYFIFPLFLSLLVFILLVNLEARSGERRQDMSR